MRAFCRFVFYSSVFKIDRFSVFDKWHISNIVRFARKGEGVREVHRTMTYRWHESYKAALLETDWTKMPERIQSAESEIHKRQRLLSEDHGGTPEERQALADAITGMKVLRREAVQWQNRQVSEGDTAQSGN
jgi:hypothetical protein